MKTILSSVLLLSSLSTFAATRYECNIQGTIQKQTKSLTGKWKVKETRTQNLCVFGVADLFFGMDSISSICQVVVSDLDYSVKIAGKKLTQNTYDMKISLHRGSQREDSMTAFDQGGVLGEDFLTLGESIDAMYSPNLVMVQSKRAKSVMSELQINCKPRS